MATTTTLTAVSDSQRSSHLHPPRLHRGRNGAGGEPFDNGSADTDDPNRAHEDSDDDLPELEEISDSESYHATGLQSSQKTGTGTPVSSTPAAVQPLRPRVDMTPMKPRPVYKGLHIPKMHMGNAYDISCPGIPHTKSETKRAPWDSDPEYISSTTNPVLVAPKLHLSATNSGHVTETVRSQRVITTTQYGDEHDGNVQLALCDYMLEPSAAGIPSSTHDLDSTTAWYVKIFCFVEASPTMFCPLVISLTSQWQSNTAAKQHDLSIRKPTEAVVLSERKYLGRLL